MSADNHQDHSMEEDPFDSLLVLEDGFYEEGYQLGVADGARAGQVEGRLFGLERGFEKFSAMGQLHGRSIVWASRLPCVESQHPQSKPMDEPEALTIDQSREQSRTGIGSHRCIPPLPENIRLEKQLRTFHALVELESISTQNKEDDVAEFDDRLKRANGKAKIIEKLVGESSEMGSLNASATGKNFAKIRAPSGGAADSGIEDISILHARH